MVALFLLVAAFGVYSWTELSIEAYPDISDTTAQVVTTYPGHAAEEVEEQVTIPLERELNGIPGLQIMRSKSTFGLSLITLVFRDGVEDYFARQRIQERINGVNLPTSATTGLDPLTSPIGEIYRYTLESPSRTQRELKELQQWVVIPTLKQVFGVADVTNFGGETTQFQLLHRPVQAGPVQPVPEAGDGRGLVQQLQRRRQHGAARRRGLRGAGHRPHPQLG